MLIIQTVSTSTSARFNRGTKLGFIGTPCGSSTPVARLSTLTSSLPICRVMSAKAGQCRDDANLLRENQARL